MKKSVLKKYANLIAVQGVNIQKGQEVYISCGLDQPEFIRILVEELYKAGAGRVVVDFSDPKISKVQIKKTSLKTLSTLAPWEVARWEHYADKLAARILIKSDDPDAFAGIDQVKLAKANQAKLKVIQPIRSRMDEKYQWCIAAVPGGDWAKKIFPDLPKAKAIEKLWEVILKVSRVTDDPVGEWKKHNDDLLTRCNYLNDLHIKELHYTASNGTNFRVSLIEDGIFQGGGENTLGGVYYNPNIPSEEVFTSPMKGKCEGIVYASLPLSYSGELIENFSIRFENGHAVEVKAEKGQQILEELIKMDEGASMLGEVALVPYDSPIRESGVLFYNTLFDENAACHLALGRGFNTCLKNFEKYTFQEAKDKGINDSITHVDFMIGTKDLSIVATTFDGKEVPIFTDGNWAF